MIKYNFKNKTILITAASKGIGFELARQLALYGANVSIISRNAKNLIIAKKILTLKEDAKIFTIKYNLEDTKNLRKIITKTEKFLKAK